MFFALMLQTGALALLAVVVWPMWSAGHALALAFGGCVALANSGLLVWRWHRGRQPVHSDGARHVKAFNRSALERFFVVAGLLAVGLGGLRLEALPLLIGFIVGQLAWVIAAAVLNKN